MKNYETTPGAVEELPRYQCHKIVRACLIGSVIQSPAHEAKKDEHTGEWLGTWEIIPKDRSLPKITVPHDFVVKHKPEAGGYFVVYEDDYVSYSPAVPFENGYTRLPEAAPEMPTATKTE